MQWTYKEEMLVYECFQRNEPLEFIAFKLNYTKTILQINALIYNRGWHKNTITKNSSAYCSFCFSVLDNTSPKIKTVGYYNHKYCNSCNIKLESLRNELITTTLINSKKGDVKTKEDVAKSKTRVCYTCKKEKDINDFSWAVTGKKIHYDCLKCRSAKHKKNKMKRLESEGYY